MIYWLLDAFNSFLIKIYDICQAYDSLVWTPLLSTTWTNSQISEWKYLSRLFLVTWPGITGYTLSMFPSAFGRTAGREWMARLMLWRVFYRVRGQCQTPDAWHNNELPPHSPCQDALALERLTLFTAHSLPRIAPRARRVLFYLAKTSHGTLLVCGSSCNRQAFSGSIGVKSHFLNILFIS